MSFIQKNQYKLLIYSFLLLSLPFSNATAQSRFELGITLGSMQYEGEIGGRFPFYYNDLHNPSSVPRLMGGINVGYNLTDFISLRGSFHIGSVQGEDRLLAPSPDPSVIYKRTRNLSFRTPILEAGISAEIYPLPLLLKRWNQNQGRFNPYILSGFNVFKFNPKSKYTDITGASYWVELKPLRTEGQGMPIPNAPDEYSLISISIPFGIGVRFNLDDHISLALEWMNRYSNTDYIDDVSGRYIDNIEFDNFFGAGTPLADQAKQKANYPAWVNGVHINGFLPSEPRGSLRDYNDFYYSLNFKVFINLDRIFGKRSSWIGGDNFLKCPTRY
jgi:hypothetical protein